MSLHISGVIQERLDVVLTQVSGSGNEEEEIDVEDT